MSQSKRNWELIREPEGFQANLETSIEKLMESGINAEPIEEVLDKVTEFHTMLLDGENHTPENIEFLSPNQIFVFGSNLAGEHGGGAARKAYDDFGAIWGQGIGLQGQSYAVPTLGRSYEKLTLNEIHEHINDLLKYCCKNRQLFFFITKIGCGIAGFSVNEIGPLFRPFILLKNVSLPKEFYDICEKLQNELDTKKL